MDFFYENRVKLEEKTIPMSIYENSNFTYLAHWHNDVEIGFVKEGSILVGVNNEVRVLEAGEAVLCCSGDIHYYESCSEDSKLIILVFKPQLIGDFVRWPVGSTFATSFLTKELNGLKDIENLLEKIVKEKETQNTAYELFIKAHIIEICATLLRLVPRNNTKDNGKGRYNIQLMQRVVAYIEKNYHEDIKLEGIAKYFNVDSFNLSKKINAITGMNFKGYLNMLRVAKAQELILNTDKPLTEIAFECGFNSIRNFNRVFKNIKGYIPSSTRREKTVLK